MPPADPPIDRGLIREILTAYQAHSCAIRAEFVSSKSEFKCFLQDFVTADGIDDRCVTNGAQRLFILGSGMKSLINFALYRMIEEGGDVFGNDHEVRRLMANAWEADAFGLYNALRKLRKLPAAMVPAKYTPYLCQLMTHTNAFPAFQRGLIALDGTFIMSEDTFCETVANIMDSIPKPSKGKFCYSNWNTLFLAFIIEHATGEPLSQALKRIVLNYCGMNNTCFDLETLRKKEHMIVSPHVTTAESGLLQTDIPSFLDSGAALAIGGGFSCVEDMTRFLQVLHGRVLNGDERFRDIFFRSEDEITDGECIKRSFLGGIFSDLDSEATGSESFERIPGSKVYTLGRYDGQSIAAISKAGAVRGYASHFFIIPKMGMIMSVMTNTSGVADPSLVVSQFIIQSVLGLKPAIRFSRQMMAEIFKEKQSILKSDTRCHQADKGFSSQECKELQGEYVETLTRRHLIIEQAGQNTLRAYMKESSRSTSIQTTKMKLIKIAENVVTFLPELSNVAIDTYHSWKLVEFQVKRSREGKIYALDRADITSSPKLRSTWYNDFNESFKHVDG
ncbi:uncharacterized protein PV09_03884 [Verruconis gallopava]|uniref:Beta-lactamase-related domain-containing protein n=1 Tax=Verruconis gallopava TaxID=253628 RepID=A0A0D2AEE6_9PEZI|nr:uncharacterized protein PV09_03884 [Verruconis gallopava]KIW05368.1 hypothetical protein PV09_03884 [Verruconis gallopava]